MTRNVLTVFGLAALVFLNGCTSSLQPALSQGGAGSTSSTTDPSLTNSGTLTNTSLSASSNPALNLFGSNGTLSNTAVAPTTTVSNLAPATSTAAACMSANTAVTPVAGTTTTVTDPTSPVQWACLSNQANQGNVTPATITGLATAAMGMMNDCGLSVRQELAQQMSTINSSDPTQVAGLFQTAKTALTQCYYQVVQLQGGSMQWAPAQAQANNYNAGNMWNMLSSFNH